MEQKLERKDIRFIWICIMIAAAFLGIGTALFHKVQPEASIDFKVTRAQSLKQAAAWIQSRGFKLDGYRDATIFSFDDHARTFLERELGLEKAGTIIQSDMKLWRWSHRWFKELKKEEFRIEWSTTGQLASWHHAIEEDAAGASLSAEKARQLAENFLASTSGKKLDELEYIETTTVERKNRVDHTLVWKKKGWDVKDATYRYRITVQGDEIGSYNEYLKVPDAWQRNYEKLRSKNQLTGQIASFFMSLTLIAMIGALVLGVTRREIRWKTAGVFAATGFVLSLIAGLNSLPVAQYWYSTTDTYGSFLTEQMMGSVFGAARVALLVGFLTAVAGNTYRKSYPGQINLGGLLTMRGLRTKRFLVETILGLTLACFFFGYQTLFYLVADHFGAWSPANIPYSDMLNTYFPWVYVLLIGFLPAVSEEFISRAFSIPFFHRILKLRWLAVIVAAYIWGFAHADYPNQPFYIRGLEVGTAGVLVGYVMLRWGIWPCLIWHYTIDALYTAEILLRSGNSYYIGTSLVSGGIMLLPLAASIWLYWRHRSFINPTPLLNEAQSEEITKANVTSLKKKEVNPSNAAVLPRYLPLSRRRILILSVLALSAMGLYGLHNHEIQKLNDYKIDRSAAEAKACSYLSSLGVDLSKYKIMISQGEATSPSTMKYLMEQKGVQAVTQLYSKEFRPSLWSVRFFIPQQEEEFSLDIDPTHGDVFSFEHKLPEDAPGAKLSREEALPIAEKFLQSFGINLSTMTLKEDSFVDLKARRDHRFEWEAKADDWRNVGEARYRCSVEVAGDRPASFYRYMKLPENWMRARMESNLFKSVLSGTSSIVMLVVVLHIVWLTIAFLRRSTVNWKRVGVIGLVSGLLYLAGCLNELPTFYSGYSTEVTSEVYVVSEIVSTLMKLAGLILCVCLGSIVVETLVPLAWDRLSSQSRAVMVRDALIGSVAFVLLSVGMQSFGEFCTSRFARYAQAPELPSPSGLDAFLPFVANLSDGFQGAFTTAVLAAIGVYYYSRFGKRPWILVLATLGFGIVTCGGRAASIGEFWFSYAYFLFQACFLLLMVFYIFRNNLLLYIVAPFLLSITASVSQLWQPAIRHYEVQALILAACVAGLLGYLWYDSRKQLAEAGQQA